MKQFNIALSCILLVVAGGLVAYAYKFDGVVIGWFH